MWSMVGVGLLLTAYVQFGSHVMAVVVLLLLTIFAHVAGNSLGTKLRALYQRKKGRDLFDLWLALERGGFEAEAVIQCFARYMVEGGHSASRAQVEANLHAKASSREFRGDINPLLRPGIDWDFDVAMEVVQDRLVGKLPGEPWKGART